MFVQALGTNLTIQSRVVFTSPATQTSLLWPVFNIIFNSNTISFICCCLFVCLFVCFLSICRGEICQFAENKVRVLLEEVVFERAMHSLPTYQASTNAVN